MKQKAPEFLDLLENFFTEYMPSSCRTKHGLRTFREEVPHWQVEKRLPPGA